MRHARISGGLSGVGLVLALAGCGGAYGSAPTDPGGGTVAAQGVVVKPQVLQFIAVGETQLLVATVAPLSATDRAVTWSSTDSQVASVDNLGRVTAHAAGTGVLITAVTRDGGFQASANVTVLPAP